jgi:hypothetical protein
MTNDFQTPRWSFSDVRKLQAAARQGLDELADLVAVARSLLDERQDEQLRAALLHISVEHTSAQYTSEKLLSQAPGSAQEKPPGRHQSLTYDLNRNSLADDGAFNAEAQSRAAAVGR